MRLLIALLIFASSSALPAQRQTSAASMAELPAVALSGAPTPANIANAVATASAPKANLSFEEYEHLLNILLPVNHAVADGMEYTMVLRFEPHLHPESQLVVRKWHNGRIQATLERASESNIWQDARASRAENPDVDVSDIAKRIAISKTGIAVSPQQAAQWHNGLFPTLSKDFQRLRAEDKKVRKTGTWDGISNGTRYELWYIEGDDEMHAVSWDTEIDTVQSGSFALAKWANPIRQYADAHMSADASTRGLRDVALNRLVAATQDLPSSQATAKQDAAAEAKNASAQTAPGGMPDGMPVMPLANVTTTMERPGQPDSSQPVPGAMAGTSVIPVPKPPAPPPLPRYKTKREKPAKVHDLPAPDVASLPDTSSVPNFSGRQWSTSSSTVDPATNKKK